MGKRKKKIYIGIVEESRGGSVVQVEAIAWEGPIQECLCGWLMKNKSVRVILRKEGMNVI